MPTEKILIDTNLLIYSIDKDSRFQKKSLDLINSPRFKSCTTSKNLSEFLTVITRKSPYSLSVHDAVSVIEAFESDFEILYPSPESLIIFKNLITDYNPSGLKIHDFEIISIALANNVKLIATVNEKDFIGIKEIQVITV